MCVVVNCHRHSVVCQNVFNERVKLYKMWKDTEATLSKKKDEQSKLEQQRKMDKVAIVTREISEVRTSVVAFI